MTGIHAESFLHRALARSSGRIHGLAKSSSGAALMLRGIPSRLPRPVVPFPHSTGCKSDPNALCLCPCLCPICLHVLRDLQYHHASRAGKVRLPYNKIALNRSALDSRLPRRSLNGQYDLRPSSNLRGGRRQHCLVCPFVPNIAECKYSRFARCSFRNQRKSRGPTSLWVCGDRCGKG